MDIEREVRMRYSIYGKQVQAIDQQKMQRGARIYTFETPNPYMAQGRRFFIVADPTEFWIWYRNTYSGPRHFYELIQENWPCRLYFDLEYQKADNPELNDDEILSQFLKFVCQQVQHEFAITITEQSFILLDSTTDKKFSVHATCHFPDDRLFPNNVAMRPFIDRLTRKMSETGIGIVKKGSEETFICDPAVYTKNRSFRIFLSSKCGKNALMKLRNSNNFYEKIPADDRQIFLDSIVIPMNYGRMPLLDIADKVIVLKRNRIQMDKTAATNNRCMDDFVENCEFETVQIGTGPSPFPELDAFVLDFAKQWNRQSEIRQWALIRVKGTDSKRVQYQFNYNKFCLRINREHQSNNIYWTVQLEREWIYQKCFDYDCRNFVSNCFPVASRIMNDVLDRADSVFGVTSKKPFQALKPVSPKRNAFTVLYEKTTTKSREPTNFFSKRLQDEHKAIVKGEKIPRLVLPKETPGNDRAAPPFPIPPPTPIDVEDSFDSSHFADGFFVQCAPSTSAPTDASVEKPVVATTDDSFFASQIDQSLMAKVTKQFEAAKREEVELTPPATVIDLEQMSEEESNDIEVLEILSSPASKPNGNGKKRPTSKTPKSLPKRRKVGKGKENKTTATADDSQSIAKFCLGSSMSTSSPLMNSLKRTTQSDILTTKNVSPAIFQLSDDDGEDGADSVPPTDSEAEISVINHNANKSRMFCDSD